MSDKKTEQLFAKALKAKSASSANANTGNYKSAVLRIQGANTIADLQKLEKSFDRVYNAGHLTVSEFQRLDSKILDKIARLEAGGGTLGISRKTLKQPSARTVEKMFGLQEGETYDYEDAVQTDMGKVRLGKYTGEIIYSENSASYIIWVKGIGNVGFGFSKAEAIADARKNINAKASKAGLGIDQSTITDHSTKSSRSKYKGRIKPYDMQEMQTRLDKYLERYNTTVKELQAKYLASGFTPMRFRWDLFSAAIAKPYDTGQGKNDLVNRIYSYADDTHIDTALRYIVASRTEE